ncbi:MAG: hypothetical protein ACO3A4_10670 [Silvanigrellaceae bacterium]
MLFRDLRQRNLFSKLVLASLVAVMVSCGQQSPALSVDKNFIQRSDSEPQTTNALMAVRSSSDEGSGVASSRLQVFARPIEPLTLQRGGSVKVQIPLADGVVNSGIVRSIEFQSGSESLKGSLVQGRTLNLVVGEETPDGRYNCRLIVKLDNGGEFVQPLLISVIP